MIYAIADLRKLVREHEDEILGDPVLIKEFMDLPVTEVKVMKVAQLNFPILEKYMKKDDIEMYMSAVRKYKNELGKLAAQELSPGRLRRTKRRRSIYQSPESRGPVDLHVFADTNCDKELVYAIVVNR